MRTEPAPHGTYAPGWLTRLLIRLSQNTPLGRGKARRMMTSLVRRLNPVSIDANLFGQNVRVHTGNNGSEMKALMSPRQYSRREFAFCVDFLGAENPVLVDVGANAGFFSLGLVGKMRGGILIAAEPQPLLHQRLFRNLCAYNDYDWRELNGRNYPQVFTHMAAIGAEAGELSLSVPNGQLGQASVRTLTGVGQIKVPVLSLEDILSKANVSHVDVLKLDVEGYEDVVLIPFLERAPQTIWPKAIVLEHCHRDRWEIDCEGVLLQAGYDIAYKDRTNLMLTLKEG